MAMSKSLGFYHEDGGCDVIYYVNEPNPKHTQVDIYGTIYGKFHQNQPSISG